MAVYLDDFFIRLMKEIWIFLVKIDIFSETISSGITHFAIWGIKHYLTLLVKSIQDHGWINFQTWWDTWGNFSRIYVGSL